MKREDISNIIGNISTKHIKEAVPVETVKKKASWAKWGTIAACLCLTVLSAAVIWHTHEPPTDKAEEKRVLHIYHNDEQGQKIGEMYNLPYVDTDLCIPTKLPNGTEIPAVVIPLEAETYNTPKENKALEEAEAYAYIDLDTASDELRKKILAARETIIYSKSWAADDHPSYIQNVITGESVQLPFFSELFPGWDIPTIPTSESRSTPDGLGTKTLYMLTIEIIDISKEYVNCRVAEDVNKFSKGQVIQVYLPDKIDSNLLNIGNTVFLIYTGADCNVTQAIIHARMITDSMESATEFAEKFLN